RARVVDAGDHVEERGLSGAVRPDEADDRALRDREVDAADRDEAAEPLGDVLGVEDVRHRRSPSSVPRSSSAPGRSPIAPSISGDSTTSSTSSPSSSATWSSRRLRWLGNRPSGRNSIIPTSAIPYSRYWYCRKSIELRTGILSAS